MLSNNLQNRDSILFNFYNIERTPFLGKELIIIKIIYILEIYIKIVLSKGGCLVHFCKREKGQSEFPRFVRYFIDKYKKSRKG